MHHKYCETRDLAQTDIFFYIEAFYNRKRCLRRWVISIQRNLKRFILITNLSLFCVQKIGGGSIYPVLQKIHILRGCYA
ncbi:MAG: hypothetical protein GY805_36390 [Chloroflexi bacterium]|nr:hypothetical protein [Chloroflexota bacterium]